MRDELQGFMDKYEEMVKRIRGLSFVDQMLSSTNLPYRTKVMAVLLPLKFKTPQMEMYDGSKDPIGHLETFKTHMKLQGFLGEIGCRAFPLTLKGSARSWFGTLRPGTIHNFEELGRQFLIQFMAS